MTGDSPGSSSSPRPGSRCGRESAVSQISRALTSPLRAATALRRRRQADWPRLPRPAVSVGNLALGGRGKTPLVAALAADAVRRGLRPAILLRGYPHVSRAADPALLLRVGAAAVPWLDPLDGGGRLDVAPAFHHSPYAGDEAAWLAAMTGVPVAAHPDRLRGADAVLARWPHTDLFLLDDALQSALQADIDIVLIDPERDLRSSRRPGAVREWAIPEHALRLCLGSDVERRAAGLRTLDGAPVTPPPRVTVCAGVGDPRSVVDLAGGLGIEVVDQIHVRDHGAPRRKRLRGAGPLLITEKDAVGWAARRHPPQCFVLGMELAGVEAVARSVFECSRIRR